MKRFFILIVFLFTISGWLSAQNYYKGILEVRVANQTLKSKNTNSTNNTQLNKIFSKFHVTKFKQLVPFAKTPELHELYQINFNGEINSF